MRLRLPATRPLASAIALITERRRAPPSSSCSTRRLDQRLHRTHAFILREASIATTSAQRLSEALDVLAGLGVEFAILHGAEAAERGAIRSDADVAVGRPPELVV